MSTPKGLILIWSGAIVDIPVGWSLCDGSNGTPDLRDKFIVGAGGSYSPGDTGGSATHVHPFTSDGHYHTVSPPAGLSSGTDFQAQTDTKTVTGTTGSGSSLPPYYSLAYIMKT